MSRVKIIDPQEYGLPPRTILEDGGNGRLVLVINRKSRLIMADGRKIVAKLAKIRESRPGTLLELRTTAPLCGKTRAYLAENSIEVV